MHASDEANRMKTVRRYGRTCGSRLGALGFAAILLLGLNSAGTADQAVEIVESSMTVSASATTLELGLEDGSSHRIELRDGRIVVDGSEIGTYSEGGAFERSWREMLSGELGAGSDFRLEAETLLAWDPPASGAPEASARALTGALERIVGATADAGEAAEAEEAVTMTGPGGTQLSIAPGKLSFETLVEQLGRLERSLGRLGEDAREAGENLGLIVHDDYEIPRGQTVRGNLALLDGDLRLGGTVEGDVLVLDGTLTLEPAARVSGDVMQVGGEVQRRGGLVSGEFLSVRYLEAPDEEHAVADADELREEIREEVRDRMRDVRRRRDHARPGFFGGIFGNIGRAVGGVVEVLSSLILLSILGALTVYFVRPRLEAVADTARNEFGRSFGIGLAGQFLFFPILLILVVAVITWLVIPFYLLAAALAGLGGYLAVAHAAGEALAARRFRFEWIERLRRANSYYYVLSGLVVLLLPFALAEALHVFGWWLGFLRGLVSFAAVAISWVAFTTGLGAVLLSRAGVRPGAPAGRYGSGGSSDPAPAESL